MKNLKFSAIFIIIIIMIIGAIAFADEPDYIIMGTYEQDANLSNGEEPIEWLVLAHEDGKLFLLSRYALDMKVMTDVWCDCVWAESDLRVWLNSDFLEHFSDNEKGYILLTNVPVSINPEYYTSSEYETQDYVFCLSYEEVMQYVIESWQYCSATPYAVSRGGHNSIVKNNCIWWLRTTGNRYAYKMVMRGDNGIWYHGYYNVGARDGNPMTCVRPAMWIDENYIIDADYLNK